MCQAGLALPLVPRYRVPEGDVTILQVPKKGLRRS